jgi:hypothetical protein
MLNLYLNLYEKNLMGEKNNLIMYFEDDYIFQNNID